MKQNILIPTPGSIVDYCVVMGPVKRVKITSVSKNAYNSYIARYIDEKGKSGGVNCRHIIRIVKYSKQIPRKYNYYAKTYSKHGREGGFVNHTKRSYCGPLTEIASIILSNHNVPVKTPIDSNKLHELYYKNSEGLVDSGQSSYYPIVSKKCFKKWVLKN